MADKKFGLSIVIRGVDRFSSVIGRVQKSISAFSSRASSRFGLLTKGFPQVKKAYGQLSDGLTDLGGRIAKVAGLFGGLAVGAAVGLWSMVESVGTAGDSLADLTKQLGVSAEALQEWRYAAEQNGITSEEMDKSVQTLSRNLGKAQFGKGPLKAFQQLRLDPKKFKSVETLLPAIADKMKAITNPAKRAAIASELFSKTGVKLIPMLEGGSAGLAKLAADARKLGIVIDNEAVAASDEFGDRLTDLKLGLQGAKNTIAIELIPVVTDLMNRFRAFILEHQPALKAFFANFAQELPGRIEETKAVLKELWDGVQPIVDVFKSLSEKIGAGNTALLVISSTIAVFLVPALAATTAAFYKLGAAMLTTPVGWFLIILGAIALAAYKIYDNWEPITQFFATWWQSVKDAFAAGVEFIAGIWNDIRTGFKEGFVEGLVAIWNSLNPAALILRAFTELVPKLRRAVAPLVGLLPDWAQKLIGGDKPVQANVFGTTLPAAAALGPARFDATQPQGIPGPQRTDTHVTVDFRNLPPGARVQSDSRGPGEFELNQGYALSVPQ
jgi:transposase-like protein